METKLCRICGKLGENYVHIFKTEGLKNKIETCLPIIVSQYCLLPDTICSECLENVDNFYSFIKNCLQNIIVLEAQYDITESCLKTKRKHEKSSLTDISANKHDKNIQTDDDDCFLINHQCGIVNIDLSVLEKLDEALLNADNILKGKDAKTAPRIPKIEPKISLVNYDNETDSDSDEDDIKTVNVTLKQNQSQVDSSLCLKAFNSNLNNLKNYFDDAESNIVNEIALRKKRKAEEIGTSRTKICKIDAVNKRKCRNPKKVQSYEFQTDLQRHKYDINYKTANEVTKEINNYQDQEQNPTILMSERNLLASMPQVCLLCDAQFPGPSALTTHVYETHGIDMAKVVASCPVAEDKRKRIPNLVKITDLKPKNELDTFKNGTDQPSGLNEDPPQLQPFFGCPLCPSVHTSRSEVFSHLRTKHSKKTSLMCSLCFHMANTYNKLASHLEICRRQYNNISSKYICKICCFHDDNCKVVENHVPVHDFILTYCKKQLRIFDPSDYVETNPLYEGSLAKSYTCSECDSCSFASFRDFSTHRRNTHQIFHCDLCNKFYGRNSHLWKHVNRLHKGHPSITCQICYKTSASKYHLAQHFNKIHSVKTYQFNDENEEDNIESFMKKKFDGFDFQSVKQSFMRQELMEQANNEANSDEDDNEEEDNMNIDEDGAKTVPPKEIDASSDLYTNIITNYTPPRNEGAYKCPKCFRGFHKKPLLKKHKKNCRPRLQKDLLTRCKSCSRIFKDRQSLTKHLINYHSEYVCEICEQKVQSKCEIVSHIRFSHPNCHLFCQFCGNIVRSKSDLIEHKKDHRNSFICQFCGDMLSTKIKLKMHILSLHRKILSLSCGICLKLFETQYILRDHVQLVHKHHLSPLTSCTVCGKNYGSKWKTYDHLNKSHGRIFKACKMCLEVYDTEDELRAHYDSVHVNGNQSNKNGLQNYENSSNKKKEDYNSDLDTGNNDNEAKLSSSEMSNDMDNAYINDQQVKISSDYEDYNNPNNCIALADLPVQDDKISLLERRLLGGSLQDSTSQKVRNEIKLEAKFVSYESPSNSNASKITEEQETNANGSSPVPVAPFSNSSKRTVYVNSNDPSVCEICLKTWPAKKHLWQHYIRCHKAVAATVCGICLKTNDNYESLQIHLLNTHPTLLHGQGFGSNFICRICGRYHNASSKLKLHMAIHENFDWALLDYFYPKNNSDLQENSSKDVHHKEDADEEEEYEEETEVKEEGEDDEDDEVNYESLIEQVEVDATSESNNDSDCELVVNKDDNCVSSSEDSVLSEENSLENRMLQNMLNEKQNLEGSVSVKQENEEEEDDQKFVSSPFENLQKFYAENAQKCNQSSAKTTTIYSSSEESEDTSDSVQSVSDDNRNGSSDSEVVRTDIYPKSDELDSAIRSITYDQMDYTKEELQDDVCDIQSLPLNQREIQSAVDSIL